MLLQDQVPEKKSQVSSSSLKKGVDHFFVVDRFGNGKITLARTDVHLAWILKHQPENKYENVDVIQSFSDQITHKNQVTILLEMHAGFLEHVSTTIFQYDAEGYDARMQFSDENDFFGRIFDDVIIYGMQRNI